MYEEVENGMDQQEEVEYSNKGSSSKLIWILIALLIIGVIIYFLLNKKGNSMNIKLDKKGEPAISVIPLSDDNGVTSSNYYDFTLTGAVEKQSMYYEILITPKSTNTLDTSLFKTYLTDQSDNAISGITLYSDLVKSESGKGSILYRSIIKKNSDNTPKQEYKDFRLRMWEDINGQTSGVFNFDVLIYAKYVEDNYVINASAPLVLNSTAGTLALNESKTIRIISDSDGLLECSSSSVLVATCEISKRMLKVNAVGYGDATITVTQKAGSVYSLPNNVTYLVSVPDNRKAAKLELEKTSGTINVGKSTSIKITTTGDGKIRCNTSNATVATCSIADQTLKIDGIAAGTAIITVSQAEGKTTLAAKDVTFEVTVKVPATPTPKPTPVPTPAATTIGNVKELEKAPYAKVYVGKNPNNYVTFNKELWRIIGVYGDNLKIIKATPTTYKQVYNKKDSDGNAWEGSVLQKYLYDNYKKIISDDASRNMILEDATWHIAKSVPQVASADAFDAARRKEWKGKIGLITSYEYLYAAPKSCWKTDGVQYKSTCGKNNWIYITVADYKGENGSWTITPDKASNRMLRVHPDRFVDDNPVSSIMSVSPVVYLKKSVSIAGGSGTKSDPYKLK